MCISIAQSAFLSKKYTIYSVRPGTYSLILLETTALFSSDFRFFLDVFTPRPTLTLLWQALSKDATSTSLKMCIGDR